VLLITWIAPEWTQEECSPWHQKDGWDRGNFYIHTRG
ncbi:uncharacterized protein METZ01_LOCUS510128, partial [marine metagenome]